MGKRVCIDQHVSSRAVGANVQSLHVCSLTWGGDAYTHKGHGHIYMYYLMLYSYTHTYVLCIEHTHLHARQSEEMIPAVVGPPRSEVS